MLERARGWGDLNVRPSFASSAGSSPGANPPRSLHESLIELLPDAMLALDVQVGKFVLANAAAERLLGWTRGQLSRLCSTTIRTADDDN